MSILKLEQVSIETSDTFNISQELTKLQSVTAVMVDANAFDNDITVESI